MYELLRPQRAARDTLPKVPEQGAATEGEGGAEGVGVTLLSTPRTEKFSF